MDWKTKQMKELENIIISNPNTKNISLKYTFAKYLIDNNVFESRSKNIEC